MSLSCYVLDDEFHAVRVLEEFIQITPGLNLAGSSSLPLKALDEIARFSPDLVFLDIDMPDINGLQMAEILTMKTSIIFITAFKEYGAEAFEKDAIDYLLKPISYERFLRCISKAKRSITEFINNDHGMSQYFFVKTGTKSNHVKIIIDEIQYVTSAGNYAEIFINNDKVLAYLTLSEIMDKLNPINFSRIHKSHIVNHKFIYSFDYSGVKLAEMLLLPIGRAYRADFKKKMNQSVFLSKREILIKTPS